MKIFLRNQQPNLSSFLRQMRFWPVSYRNLAKLPTRTFVAWIPFPEPVRSLHGLDLDFLFRYEVFPPNMLASFGEWRLQDRSMETGDIIVQQAQIPPFPVSLKLIFGVRVFSVYRTDTEAGFAYETLVGHPETGTNRFCFFVEEDALFCAVHTVAAPGLFLSRLLAPFFTNWYVNFCNRKALLRLRQNFLKHNLLAKAAAPARVERDRL